MKNHSWNREVGRRVLSLFLAVCVGMLPALLYSTPSAAAASSGDAPVPSPSASPQTEAEQGSEAPSSAPPAPVIPSSCDEAYYATLDYYGQLTEGGVVKSYVTNGSSKITDYGNYDDVINLTDNRQPTRSDGMVTFDLSGDTPQRFYFEGKTAQPFENLPWTISLSYTLNGVPTPADQLAGKTGEMEIHLDVAPNSSASDYSRDNLILTATTAFHADDILSLEAPGAQVQLIGNLRSVLYMVLPGEEQHFILRVGSDDFSFGGMIFLAVPATLQQLDQIADLREAKDKTEDSYDAINDSLDVILNTLDGMSGSLNTAASGLEQLNSARNTISAGKNGVYDNADLALGDLDTMADALAPATAHLESASQALTDINDSLTSLTQTAVGLKPELETTRSIIKELQTDTTNLRSLLTSVESYTKNGSNIASDLSNDLEDLEDNLSDLQTSLNTLQSTLSSTKGISTIDTVSVGGMTTAQEVEDAVAQAQAAKTQYTSFLSSDTAAAMGLTADNFSFYDFLTNPNFGNKSDTEANEIIQLLSAASDPDFAQQLQMMETANSLIPTVNKSIKEVNALVTGIAKPTASVVDDLSDLCYTLGENGISADLESLSDLLSSLLKDVDSHKGEATTLTEHLDELGDLVSRVSQSADTALDQLQTLNDTVNTYIPDAQQALADSQTLTGSTASALRDSHSLLSSLESLMKQSDGDLDSGTKQSLSGISDALRRSSAGLSETNTIRNAKTTISDLIDDEWDSHTGEDNNLLLMDSQASPISLTSEKNTSPTSIQYLMRTQEIKVADSSDNDTSAQQEEDNGTFWSRIGAMFHDFWSTLTSPFRRD